MRQTRPAKPQGSGTERWLLLIHQIPPKPDYLRVKIGRRLQRLGAVAIKSSVYALPASDETLEDFQWVAREIVEGKGEASIVEARFIEGLSDTAVVAMFQTAREGDYRALAKEARPLRFQPDAQGVARLRKRLTEVAAIDYFGASGREAAEALVRELEERMEPPSTKSKGHEPTTTRPSGRTWVTRVGIKVDRIASAWLIEEFIDRQARFKFVPGKGYRPADGELRFDMFEAEYTHEGDRCTFEVLLQRFGLDDPALHELAQVVHDIDLKDGKFGRAEAAGLDRLISGLAAATADDQVRLVQGRQLFASLYAAFASPRP